MSRLNIILFPAVLIFSVILIWFFAKPVFDKARKLDTVKRVELEQIITQEESLKQRTEKITAEEMQEDHVKSILDALPAQKEVNSLIAQIEFIANKNNINLNSISAEELSPSASSTTSSVASGSDNFRIISGNIELKGGYGQLKQILKDIRRLDRIVNITRISVSNSGNNDQGGTTGKYNLEFKTYWQPVIGAQMVKAGLESKESGMIVPAITR